MSLIDRMQESVNTLSDEFLMLFLIVAIPVIIGCIVWLLSSFYDSYKVGIGVAIFLGLMLTSGWLYFIYASLIF